MNQPLRPHVASFVDWSPALTVATIQRDVTFLERKLSAVKVSSRDKALPLRYPVPCAQSGRMFWNQRQTTTRGELSIIDGICRNRSDLHRDRQQRLNRQPSSHKFAWHYNADVTQQRRDALRSRAERSTDMEEWQLGLVRKERLDMNDEHVMTSLKFDDKQRQESAQNIAIYSHAKRKKLGRKSRRVGGAIVARQVERSSDNPEVILRKTVLDVFLPLTRTDTPPRLTYTNADASARRGSFTTEELLELRDECEAEEETQLPDAPPSSPRQ